MAFFADLQIFPHVKPVTNACTHYCRITNPGGQGKPLVGCQVLL